MLSGEWIVREHSANGSLLMELMLRLPNAFESRGAQVHELGFRFDLERLHALGALIRAGVAEHVGIVADETIGSVIIAA